MAETHTGKAQAWGDPLGYLQDASGSLVSIKSVAEVWAAIIEGATMTEGRAEEAQWLLDEGRVEVISKSSVATEAAIQGDYNHYSTIVYASGRSFCTCNWGLYYPNDPDLCVHALALRLAVKKEEGDREA